MSAHLDLFIKCDLKPDVPQRVVDGIQYLTDPLFELTQSVETEGIWADFWKDWDKFLLNDPKFETFSDFRKEEFFQLLIRKEGHLYIVIVLCTMDIIYWMMFSP